jgi:hypothetical protein
MYSYRVMIEDMHVVDRGLVVCCDLSLPRPGIKVSLPCESATGTCFLELYCQSILALQEASGAAAAGRALPLAIMTSDDTHARTEALLQQHNFFGMKPGQVSSAVLCWRVCWCVQQTIWRAAQSKSTGCTGVARLLGWDG